MAASENGAKTQDRTTKKRPFAWMKKLANLGHSNSNGTSKPKSGSSPVGKSRKGGSKMENIVPSQTTTTTFDSQKPLAATRINDDPIYTEPSTQPNSSHASLPMNEDSSQVPDASNKSTAPTLETNPETINSDGGQSKAATAGTTNTFAGGISSASGGGDNSIFSSSNHSGHSLTTTLTTIQSNTATGGAQASQQQQQTLHQHQHPPTTGHRSQPSQSSTYFSHEYPVTPASAVPQHLNPHATHIPMTYRSATANNLLSDNASVLTLASSSNTRRRRNSLDTNASVRAIPPSSVWGGSRESLPLSVVSQSTESGATVPSSTTARQEGQTSQTGHALYQSTSRPSIGGLASAERASVYSSSGVTAPALSSERNSLYAGKSGGGDRMDGSSLKGSFAADAGSVRSGYTAHGRTDSIGGSISGMVSPREPDD